MFYEDTDNYYPLPVSFTLRSEESDVCTLPPLQWHSTKIRLGRVLSRIFVVQMPVNTRNILGTATRFTVIRFTLKRTATCGRSVIMIMWVLSWRMTRSLLFLFFPTNLHSYMGRCIFLLGSIESHWEGSERRFSLVSTMMMHQSWRSPG